MEEEILEKLKTTEYARRCCHKHFKEDGGLAGLVFIVCETCGNKRCPKATDCDLSCTNSNETGQSGSRYQCPKLEVDVQRSSC